MEKEVREEEKEGRMIKMDRWAFKKIVKNKEKVRQ